LNVGYKHPFYKNISKNSNNTHLSIVNNCSNPIFNKCNIYFKKESFDNIRKNSSKNISLCNTMNIIVSDDEVLNRKSTIRILKNVSKSLNLKINIIEAVDGIETVSLFYKYLNTGTKISLIFSDENMNFMNGTKSCDLIKEIIIKKKLDDIPFYLLTACDRYVIDQKSHFNVTKILEKPFQKNIAIEILKNCKI
jgi:response regulator RpfG family c-di-GMP phosphodiesterase